MTWKTLSHPNVLPLLGVTMIENHFAMISEWMANGSITEFVWANRGVNRFKLVRFEVFCWHCSLLSTAWLMQLQDVAEGLIYIHSKAMIHGDLKGVCFSA